jgi:hypothetical protein
VSYSSPPAQVAAPAPFIHAPWRWLDRLVVTGAGGVLLVLLAVALWLPPSPLGLGTHRQLGLPPCTLLDWYGFRCPSCGMTTSWSYLMRGQFVSAVQANAGGAMLAAAALVSGPWLLASGIRGRWISKLPADVWIITLTGVILATTLTQWILRLLLVW